MKILKYTVLVLYLVAAVFLTACMFFVNSHGNVKFDDTYLIGMKEKISNFSDYSLLYGKTNLDNVSSGKEVLYYSSNQVKSGVVKDIKGSNLKNRTYVVDKNTYVSSSDMIGTIDSTKSIPFIGAIFSFATSSTGYLLCVLFPIAIIFLFQIFTFLRARKNA